MQEESLQKPSFSGSVTDMHQKPCLDPRWASIWESFGQPKSIQNRSRSHLERHQVANSDFEARVLAGGEVWRAPETWTLVPGYICILEFRARFARAQFSYLHFEELSLAGKWCAAALLWDPDSLSWFIHLFTGVQV